LNPNIDIKSLNKLYYSIGEVASMFDVNHSLIRFWETEFKIIRPKKNPKGNRMFSPKDIENFNKIYQLVKVQGFTLEGAKKELKKKSEIDPTAEKPSESNAEIIERLEEIKRKLIAMKSK